MSQETLQRTNLETLSDISKKAFDKTLELSIGVPLAIAGMVYAGPTTYRVLSEVDESFPKHDTPEVKESLDAEGLFYSAYSTATLMFHTANQLAISSITGDFNKYNLIPLATNFLSGAYEFARSGMKKEE